MEMDKNYGFATRQIHAGAHPDSSGALCTPIYQTSTFRFDSVEQGGARFAGEEDGFIYTRLGNPNLKMLGEKMASLEGGEAGLACASGMGAITSALWSVLKAGDEIVADETLYGCTFAYLSHGLPRFDVTTQFIDMSDLELFKKTLSPKTKVVYFESPCNPNMKINDIAEISRIAHEYNPEILVMVDNTFCSPYLQRPLALGADVVLHSATKYLNGHGDVIAGIIVGKKDFIQNCQMFAIKDMTGATLSPFDAFLICRGLKTLDIRMERHCDNAERVVEFLCTHPAVKKVYYPGLPDFPNHEVAKRQMSRFGGMISFELKADRSETAACLNRLKLCAVAVSLGDAETLVEHPASMTHSAYSAQELESAGIPVSLIRISVGLENPEDVIADLKAAFDTI